MIPTFRTSDPAFPVEFARRLKRHEFSVAGEPLVVQILEDVRRRGDEAILYWTEKLDKVKLTPSEMVLVPSPASGERLKEAEKIALSVAAENIRRFHASEIPTPRMIEEKGFWVGTHYAPLERVGLYIPGGKALYPSTVLMASIPARVAGVKEIIMVTPPRREGIPPALEFAAYLGGVDRIYTVGGVQAVAALAFGTSAIPPVDKIVGPGNRYVAEAKRLLYGIVGIDLIAGPTELCIIADANAPGKWIAADLIAQAEHDEAASPLCFTLWEKHLEEIPRELTRLLENHPRRKVAEKSLGTQGMLVYCASVDEALSLVNRFSPEHLELMVEHPQEILGGIRHAGAVFLGSFTPEAVGDYIAGPSHILPTQRAARFSSPLGIEDFLKRISVIEFTPLGLNSFAPHIMTLAEMEGLPGHGESVRIRLEPSEG